MNAFERRVLAAHNLHHPDHLSTWMKGELTHSTLGCEDCDWWAWCPR